MKTMMRKLKPPSSREDLQSRILDFITAALPSLAAPLVCRFSLAGSAWTLSGSVRQKNVCTTQKRPPAPRRLPPNLHPFAPSYVNLLDDPQALWFSIHHLIRNIPLRKRQTLSVAPLWNSWRASHSSSPLSSSDHPSITAPKAPRFFPLPFVSPWPPLSIQMKIKGERESESWEGWQAEGGAWRGGGWGGENVPSLLSGLGGVLPH